jgi:hypothetical protein
MILFLMSLLNPLLADSSYTELKQNEPAPYAGILLTKEAIAKIYADQEAKIAKIKVDHSYVLENQKLSNQLKYDLLSNRYKLDKEMYQAMILNRDNAIKNMPIYNKNYKSDWSMIGGFVLGSIITVGIVYSIDHLHNQ